MGHPFEPCPAPLPAGAPPGGRYCIVRSHAKGGLGEIFVAHDRELHREVALKEMQAHAARDADSRSRFLLEAEVTGNLEHPNIVPVYGLGVHPDGRPYYAMRFIRGESLLDAARRWHESAKFANDAESLSERSIEFRKLLARMIDVCDAVEYAHSRGVLHRDLKPGNVMLGNYGETLVVDWGLAKARGKREAAPTSPTQIEKTLLPSAASSVDATSMGTRMGTPAYMSPEQAQGQLDQLGPAADVYSLGATLYYVLTGRPPFTRRKVDEVLADVIAGEFPPPRTVHPKVPRPLEAICLRAMARSPDRRYAGAKDLARDIEKWLADEPVAALRESPFARLSRWGRRHRGVVRSLLATAGLLGVAAMVAYSRESKLRQTANDALASELAANEREAAERRSVMRHARQSHSLRLTAESEIERDRHPIRALLLAVESAEIMLRSGEEPNALTHQSLLDGLAIVGGEPLSASPSEVHSLTASADGRWLFGGCADGAIRWWDLANSADAPPRELRGPSGPVAHVVATPDGQRVVATCQDGTLRVWHVADARGATDDQVLSQQVALAARPVISPDGRWLAAAESSNAVRLWDLESGKSRTLANPAASQAVLCLAFSPDGRWLAAGGLQGALLVWDLESEAPCELHGHTGGVAAFAFSPDGRTLASASWDGTARLWNVNDWQSPPRTLHGSSPLACAAYTPDGRFLAAGDDQGFVRLWDVSAADVNAASRVLNGHDGAVSSVAVSADGRWLTTASDDRTVLVWDLAAPDLEAASRTLRGHEGPLVGLIMLQGGPRIATASRDGGARLWNLADLPDAAHRRALRDRDHGIAHFASDPHDRWLLTAGWGDTATIWDLASDDENPRRVLPGRGARITSLAVDPTGKIAATGDERGTVRLWELGKATEPRELPGHVGNVNALSICPAGRWLGSVGDDGTLRVWDLASLDLAASGRVLARQSLPMRVAAFSPNGQWLVAAGDDHIVRLWPAPFNESTAGALEFKGHAGRVVAVAFCSHSHWLATASWDGTVRSWELGAQDPASTSRVYQGNGPIHAVSVHADRRWLAAGGADGSTRVWDLHSPGAAKHVLQGHEGDVVSMAASADGRWLATGSNDATARLFDLADPAPAKTQRVLSGHKAVVSSVAYRSDGGRLLTASWDGTVRWWNTKTADLLQQARAVAGRELTVKERELYLLDTMLDEDDSH